MKDKVRDWLETGKVDLFLGYKKVDGHPLPHAFSKENLAELEELIVSPARYALEKLASEILAIKPSLKIGILGRDCNRRALNVLAVHQQITPGQIEILEVNCCPSPLRKHADCSTLAAPDLRRGQTGVGRRQQYVGGPNGAIRSGEPLFPVDVRIPEMPEMLWLPGYLPGVLL